MSVSKRRILLQKALSAVTYSVNDTRQPQPSRSALKTSQWPGMQSGGRTGPHVQGMAHMRGLGQGRAVQVNIYAQVCRPASVHS